MLLRKMLRDMKSNITQFISIFIMAILGVLVYSGINAEWFGMYTETERYYEETNLADIWVISDNFTTEEVAKIEALSGVKSAMRRLTFDGIVTIESKPVLNLNVIDETTISRPYVVEGDAFDLRKDGLWLDASFAKVNQLKVGDKLTIEAMGMQLTKPILGLILHPEYVYNVNDESEMVPDPLSHGFAFIPRSIIENADQLPNNQLLVSLDSDEEAEDITSQIEALFSTKTNIILTRDTHPSTSMLQNEIEQNKAMGGVFPVVFFLIAALTMLTTMTRITSNQRTQIGTLKALGYARRKILYHYVSYGLWIGLVGGVIGLFLGPLIIPPILFAMQKTMYTLPDWYIVISPSSILIVGLAVLCCGASSYFACHQQLKEVPAATLRPRAPKTGRHSNLEKSKLWHRFGFSTQWNIRDIMRSRIRSLMAIVGVIGCTALLLFGLGLRDTINEISDWMYEDLNTYASKITFDENITDEEISQLSSAFPGQLVQEANIEMNYGQQKKSGLLTVLDEGNEVKFEDKKRQLIQLPSDGIGISYKIASLLKVNVNDTINWRIYGEKNWREATVTAIYRTPMSQGIAMTKEVYEQMENVMEPTALLSKNPAIDADQFLGVNIVQDKSQLVSSFDSMLESMKMIIAILVLAAILLGSVVLYNLGALSFTERIRELTTLSVLGFFPKQIRLLLQMQNIWLTIVGIVLGVPSGYGLVVFMLSTMSDSSDMMMYISLTSLSVSVLGTFVLSLFVNFLLSNKVKRIDMVSALKSVE